ncbi:MAG TPA: gluconate 2-dehydrogenase subunit 3 family protein [Terriglobales bacterium]|nr:gluconate 2-dehydrogenase subunit 3 family protein [Terriglobales bacterium]
MNETQKISRRNILKSLTVGAAASTVLRVIPAQAAEYAHHMIAAEKAATKTYAPKFFNPHDYKTLQTLCQTIIPADSDAGGAIEAGAPEFIDLLTSENTEYQRIMAGGLLWLDSTCSDRYNQVFLDCTPAQQKEILDRIAYRNNALSDSSLSQGVEFFSFLRNMTSDGFFTSEIGIKYLGYIGSAFLKEWPGCPPVPGV